MCKVKLQGSVLRGLAPAKAPDQKARLRAATHIVLRNKQVSSVKLPLNIV